MTTQRADARKRIEGKRLSEAELHAIARCDERRREVVQHALERVYAGGGFEEADALLDALADLGARVVVGP